MNSLQRHAGRCLPGLIGLGIMLIMVLLVSGCTQPAPTSPTTPQVSAPYTTPVNTTTTTIVDEGKKMVTYTETDNGTTGNIAHNTRFAIQLNENPTTGFMWNATLSPGLELQSSDYQQNDAAPGMAGVGGIRTWVIIAKDPGNQKFSAIYQRSWEPTTGNETAYTMNINVVTV